MTKWPEFVLFISTIIFILITIVVYLTSPEDISFHAFRAGGVDIDMWLLCIITIIALLVAAFFALSWRTY